MEKMQLKFSKKLNVTIPFQGFEVSVIPIIGLEDQKSIRNIYMESLFINGKNEQWDEQFAEFMFRRAVLTFNTNIDMDSIKDIDKIDDLVWGELYEKIMDTILNYYDVRNGIIVSMENEIKKMQNENSIVNIISEFIDKSKPFIDNFLNMKPEDFEKMKSEASEIIEKTKSEPIASVLSDMKLSLIHI